MYIPYLVCVIRDAYVKGVEKNVHVGVRFIVCEMTKMTRDEARQKINDFLVNKYNTMTLVRSQVVDAKVVQPMLKKFPDTFKDVTETTSE